MQKADTEGQKQWFIKLATLGLGFVVGMKMFSWNQLRYRLVKADEWYQLSSSSKMENLRFMEGCNELGVKVLIK